MPCASRPSSDADFALASATRSHKRGSILHCPDAFGSSTTIVALTARRRRRCSQRSTGRCLTARRYLSRWACCIKTAIHLLKQRLMPMTMPASIFAFARIPKCAGGLTITRPRFNPPRWNRCLRRHLQRNGRLGCLMHRHLRVLAFSRANWNAGGRGVRPRRSLNWSLGPMLLMPPHFPPRKPPMP